MKKLIFISVLVVSLLSCKTQKDALYGKCQKPYYACTQILLSKNGQFEYFQFYDVGGSTIVNGHWQSKKDTIILNTNEQQENRLDTVIESTIKNLNGRIKFEGGFWGYITVDSTKFNIDPEQQMIDINMPLRNIIFYFLDDLGNTIPLPYTVKNPSTNQLDVKVRRLTTSLILKNQKFIKTKAGLKDIDQNWTIKKTSIKSKQW